ncbi:hypothetical protein MMC27_001840 [Xylographa pallens]|nr:hypothetical protein [Xylographa pallens]
MATFQFQTGKTHRLRLVNVGGDGIQRFSIDGHVMTVIANDFTPVVPYQSDIISLGVGQRTDIIATAEGLPNSSWWMRSDFTTEPCGISNQPHALAAIYYSEANTSLPPKSSAAPALTNDSVLFCQNVSIVLLNDQSSLADRLIQSPLFETQPLFASAPPDVPAKTQLIQIVLGANSSGNTLFFMNGESYRGDYNSPILLLANLGNVSYPEDPQWNVYNFGSNSSVRLVITNNSTLAHPIHLHGHSFWVLAEGVGTWDGAVQASPTTQRRDVQILQAMSDPANLGYLVIEFLQDNPGVWPLHCHIAW